MPAMSFRAVTILSVFACLPAAAAAAEAVVIPPGIATHDDGRAPIESLYRASLGLVAKGWTAEVGATSSPAGTTAGLPIIALRSPKPGPAVWILTGIHGEERSFMSDDEPMRTAAPVVDAVGFRFGD